MHKRGIVAVWQCITVYYGVTRPAHNTCVLSGYSSETKCYRVTLIQLIGLVLLRPAQSVPSQSAEVISAGADAQGTSTAKGKKRGRPRKQSAKGGVAMTAAARRPVGRPRKQK
jgi:hypothetical protein